MIVEILKCKDCGAILVIDRKMLWATKSCSTCESRDIEVWSEKEEKEDRSKKVSNKGENIND